MHAGATALHAGFLDPRTLALWAMAGGVPVAAHETLQAVLRAAGVDGEGVEVVLRRMWLPPGLVESAGKPARGRAFTAKGLREHRVAAIELDRRRFAGLCGFVATQPAALERLAPDFAALVHAWRLAAMLVARQRFIPGVVIVGDQPPRSWWHARIEGGDAETLAALACALPHSARALTRSAQLPRPDGPRALLRTFVEESVDLLVREGVAGSTTQGRGSAPLGSAAAPAHRAWLLSLAAREPELDLRPSAARELAAAIGAWQRPLLVAAAAVHHVLLRLEEPGGEGAGGRSGARTADGAADRAERRAAEPAARPAAAPWHLHLLVRPHDDPSLLVPYGELLAPARASVARRAFPPAEREAALIALQQAAALSPAVARGLRDPAAGPVALTTVEAHAFLTQEARALAAAGFVLQLPAWWTSAAARARLAVKAQVRGGGGNAVGNGVMSLDALLTVDWTVLLGGAEVSVRELLALARQKATLVHVRGRFVEVDAGELDAALRFLAGGARTKLSARELLALGLGARSSVSAPGGEGVALPVAEVAAADSAALHLLARLDGDARFEERPTPPALRGTLRPYQRRGWSWLKFMRDAGLGACLADDMGLGKTVQALALLQAERDDGERRPTLLCCPTSVVGNWQREAARFTPELAVLVHHGLERARDAAALARAVRRHALVITSYALLQRDVAALARVRWAGVVLDEAQNIKNAETKQAQAARALTAEWRVALTGTPIENHVGELWSLFEFLNPGLLGPHEQFRREFLRPIHLGGDRDAAARLKRIAAPFLLRRAKSDPALAPELPAKIEHAVVCSLTREQASLYAAAVEAMTQRIETADGIERRGLVLALLTRLKQVCNHPAHLLADGSPLAGRSGKLERLVEMAEEVIAAGERALVFTQYREMGELLAGHLAQRLEREVAFLHGGTPRAQRERLVARFQSEDAAAPPLFVLSLKAGGTGLNLTRATHVFHFDRWWNPAVEAQATDRAHRIGQTRRVQVHKLVCAGTLEERIDALLEAKQGVAEQVVGCGEARLTELSNRELRELVALAADAVADGVGGEAQRAVARSAAR